MRFDNNLFKVVILHCPCRYAWWISAPPVEWADSILRRR